MPDRYGELERKWLDAWQESLTIWSPFTRLKNPIFCKTKEDEEREGLTGSFAMIRLSDHAIVVSLRQVSELGLQDFAKEILAHEIGHHILLPGDLADLARMNARMNYSLPKLQHLAPLVGNLYADLLINDRLFRENSLRLDQIYQKLPRSSEKLWTVYMRIYELLWSLKAGTLASKDALTDEMEGDAQLGYSLIRTYSRDALRGCGRFAALCFPYLVQDDQAARAASAFGSIFDTEKASDGQNIPMGLTEREDDEEASALHPSLEAAEQPPRPNASGGNRREPFEYRQILKSLNVDLSDKDIAARYYKERALPYLVPFPRASVDAAQEPLYEGVSVWDVGTPLQEINWVETAVRSPIPIPGYTIVEHVYAVDKGAEKSKESVDLDLYVDCSGSMPNPIDQTSFLTLAGAIVALSALRAGSAVQATLWSGTNQFETTEGFVKNERDILRILCGYFGGGTAFPLHILRKTYQNRKPTDRKVHILIISDDGVTTIFDNDELGKPGDQIARTALEKAHAGGTMVLNLYRRWQEIPLLPQASEMGWDIAPISSWESLVEFARRFARKHYQEVV